MDAIEVKLNPTLAELLVRIARDLGTDDLTGVLSRALGLLDLAQRGKAKGQRLCLVDAEANATPVMF